MRMTKEQAIKTLQVVCEGCVKDNKWDLKIQ